MLADILGKEKDRIEAAYPRQCEAIRSCLSQLSTLEKENCANPDLPAGCFGRLMGELLVWKEDLWSETLRQMGNGLGRFIYLADAAVDYAADEKKKKYNPFLAMGRCTGCFEKLPLVQDKAILDNILYSGVWMELHRQQRKDQRKEEQ